MSRTAMKDPKALGSGGLQPVRVCKQRSSESNARSSRIHFSASKSHSGCGVQQHLSGAKPAIVESGLVVLSGYSPRAAEILKCGAPLTFQILLTFDRTVYSVDDKLLNTFVGRHPECNIHVNTEFTSRAHARFSVRDDGIHLIDNSRNGTVVKTDAGEVFYLRKNLRFPMIGSGVISFGCSIEDAGVRLVQYACKPC